MLKRKRKFKEKNKAVRFILLAFIFSLLFIGVSYSLFSQKLSILGKIKIVPKNENIDGFNVEYTITDKWYSNSIYYYNIKFKVINSSNTETNKWQIRFNIPSDVVSIQSWSSNSNISGSKAFLSSMSYNSLIKPGQSQEFGCTLSTEQDSNYKTKGIVLTIFTDGYPSGTDIVIKDIEEPEVPDEPDEPDVEKIKVELTKTGEWIENNKNVIQINAKVTNIYKLNISAWDFELGDIQKFTLKSSWNANYILSSGSLKFSNVAYNGTINVGQSIEFGFIIISDQEGYIPNILKTNAVVIK